MLEVCNHHTPGLMKESRTLFTHTRSESDSPGHSPRYTRSKKTVQSIAKDVPGLSQAVQGTA